VTYDDHGRLINEMNTAITSDGKTVSTNTTYNGDNGRPVCQNVSVRDSVGKVTSTKRDQRQVSSLTSQTAVSLLWSFRGGFSLKEQWRCT
jgi:hypothetical protein